MIVGIVQRLLFFSLLRELVGVLKKHDPDFYNVYDHGTNKNVLFLYFSIEKSIPTSISRNRYLMEDFGTVTGERSSRSHHRKIVNTLRPISPDFGILTGETIIFSADLITPVLFLMAGGADIGVAGASTSSGTQSNPRGDCKICIGQVIRLCQWFPKCLTETMNFYLNLFILDVIFARSMTSIQLHLKKLKMLASSFVPWSN